MANSTWYFRVMGISHGPIHSSELVERLFRGTLDWDSELSNGENGPWTVACDIKGLAEGVSECGKQARNKQQADHAKELERAKEQSRWDNLVVSTGPPSAQFAYSIIDTVFAVDGDGETRVLFGENGDPNIAFHKVKHRLRQRAFALGADCVINCQFEYRTAVSGGLLGSGQAIELFAYGTAIRFLKPKE